MRKDYFKKLTTEQEQFIIQELKEEWILADKALKRHELLVRAKKLGIKTGETLLGIGLLFGVLSVAAVAPNIFAAFGKMGAGRRYIHSSNFDNEIHYGSSKNYWKYVKKSPTIFSIELTKKGKEVALRRALQQYRLPGRLHWDGRWRLVMFDIPKKYSAIRDALRRKLHEMGMYPLQESIFVYPYPCREEVMLWVELYEASRAVQFAEAVLDGDQELRKIFNLKLA